MLPPESALPPSPQWDDATGRAKPGHGVYRIGLLRSPLKGLLRDLRKGAL